MPPTMPEPLSIIWSIAMQLKILIGAKNSLKKDCESLLKVIEKLHANLQRLEGSPDVDQFERVLNKIRISSTRCYAMLEAIEARSWTDSLLNQKLSFFNEKPSDLIKKQQSEFYDLIDELLGELCTRGVRKAETDDIYEAGSKETRLLGVSKLRAVPMCGKNDDAILLSGEKIRYKIIEDTIENVGVVYTLEMEIKSFAPGLYNWLLQDRTHLSAMLAVNSSSGQSTRVLQITEEDKSSGGDNPTACISDEDGVVAHVQTKNQSWFNNAGTILMRDHFRRSLILRLRNGYKPQIYDAEILVRKDRLPSDDLLKLRILGKKFEDLTYYKCDTEETGEVLAVYRHRKSEASGLLHLLGRANQMEIQTIIVASFAALGLTSDF
ncbi:hypothetical protein MPTK1_7g16400 [Marchantia polymorpha subsp. ruderalis]|nr:hypothetical protein MARPO_0123s0022 [Marchantia polymorpha]BBN17709.1 hypothetical protein Mp_7g16400 [Marchantia polymorpha subsp. ruderalis]|eukprot:PTQ30533.1 hypothetical protein MARPO_0123s0022 [Marchantia polymorpha]